LMPSSLVVLAECIFLIALSSFASSMTVTSFFELVRTVAANWKMADEETKDYCVEVARSLKERHTKLAKVGDTCCLSTIDSVSPGPTEETKPRNTNGKTKDTVLTEFGAKFCLHAMGSVSPGPTEETKQRKVQLPISATHALEDQQCEQDQSMHAPMGIFPVAYGQDTTMSRDGRRTWLMELIDQYHRDQAATITNATTSWGNYSLNRTAINMLRPMPTGVIQETIQAASMPIMTGIAVGQTGTDHQDAQQKFRAVRNASRRASISNMMTLPGRAPMPDGIRCFGQQPSPNKKRHSAPECPNPFELERSRAIYDIQELDVTNSSILGMWWSSKVQETDEF
jgi:hypothetical protein